MSEEPEPYASAEGLLGSLEFGAMKALWEKSPATVNDVRDHINQSRPAHDHLAYTTVMTVLARLHDKALATRERIGRGYSYRPTFSEPELVAHLSRRDVVELVDRYGPVALSQFAAALEESDPAVLARIMRLAAGDEHA